MRGRKKTGVRIQYPVGVLVQVHKLARQKFGFQKFGLVLRDAVEELGRPQARFSRVTRVLKPWVEKHLRLKGQTQ